MVLRAFVSNTSSDYASHIAVLRRAWLVGMASYKGALSGLFLDALLPASRCHVYSSAVSVMITC